MARPASRFTPTPAGPPADDSALLGERTGEGWISRRVAANGIVSVSWQQISCGKHRAGRRVDVHLQGPTLQIWDGEELLRAGVARITLSDPGEVTGGLLVRQNFQELDIGMRKADALARRLQAVSDDLRVEVDPAGMAAALRTGTLPTADVLVDATVSNSVGAALGSVWESSGGGSLVATVATDRATATLRYLSVTRPPGGPTPEDLVPTFHGSAADLAGIAASLVSLLGPHLESDVVGCHLISLPHGADASSRPCHEWIDIA